MIGSEVALLSLKLDSHGSSAKINKAPNENQLGILIKFSSGLIKFRLANPKHPQPKVLAIGSEVALLSLKLAAVFLLFIRGPNKIDNISLLDLIRAQSNLVRSILNTRD